MGYIVMIGRAQGSLDHVAATAQRNTSQDPFFVIPDGTLLTKIKFSKIVKAALEELDLPQEQFVRHSFEVEAATTAAQSGLEVSIIITLDKWNSAAFLRYLRTPWERLASGTARGFLTPTALL